jgi:adenine-specific DNA-methyltransferase
MNVTAHHSECISPDLTEQSRSISNDGSLAAVANDQVHRLQRENANNVQLLARLRRLVRKKTGRRLSALPACRAILQGTHPDREIRDFFENLPSADKHYWIATYYALLMPQKKRRKLAAYFTPPQLANYAIDKLRELGIHPGKSRILDPASGGAAFLVPLAEAIALDARRKQLDPRATLDKIRETIAGIEIDKSLVRLSDLLLADLLAEEISKTRRRLRISITNGDTLETVQPVPTYDAVIGNPPYGRVFRPAKAVLSQYASVISDGYVNKYALFVERAIAWARPGGVICLIIPMSFLGGPYFAALRKHILEKAVVISLDPIEQRSDLFIDVLCDVCVLTLRKKGTAQIPAAPTSSLIRTHRSAQPMGTLDIPASPSDRMWALPDITGNTDFFDGESSFLEDYGYLVKAGYFVWNREQNRYRVGQVPRKNEVPLYWAHNIKANCVVEPLVEDPTFKAPVGFVRLEKDSPVAITSDAILLQRTSNRRQKRRLIAGLVFQRRVVGGCGFVSENHTILVLPKADAVQTVPLKTLCRLLNSAAVDGRYRRISGTVSVSVKALRSLPLPPATRVVKAFDAIQCNDEAAEEAYCRMGTNEVGQARRAS